MLLIVLNHFFLMKTSALICSLLFFFGISIPKSCSAQTLKACDVITVEAVNAALDSHLVFDAHSIVNKSGIFECRYTDANNFSTYVAIGLLSAKIEYGYDLLTADFSTNQAAIAAGKKAVGKFTVFKSVDIAGKNAYYMTGEKDVYSPEAFQFKFRKGDYIVTVSSGNMSLAKMTAKVNELIALFSKL